METCPHCRTQVIATSERSCPSCRQSLGPHFLDADSARVVASLGASHRELCSLSRSFETLGRGVSVFGSIIGIIVVYAVLTAMEHANTFKSKKDDVDIALVAGVGLFVVFQLASALVSGLGGKTLGKHLDELSSFLGQCLFGILAIGVVGFGKALVGFFCGFVVTLPFLICDKVLRYGASALEHSSTVWVCTAGDLPAAQKCVILQSAEEPAPKD